MHSLWGDWDLLRSQNLDQQLKPNHLLLMDSVHTSERPDVRSQYFKDFVSKTAPMCKLLKKNEKFN
jgi:hypothetical protein